MIAEKWVESYSRLAESDNTKIVALPTDVMTTVNGLLKGFAPK